MEGLQEKFYGGEAQTREAFDELCAMVGNLMVSMDKNVVYCRFIFRDIQSEREERRDQVRTKLATLRERNAALRERNTRLRSKYQAMVDA